MAYKKRKEKVGVKKEGPTSHWNIKLSLMIQMLSNNKQDGAQKE